MHISQLKKSLPDIWLCINPRDLKIKFTGKRSNWHGGRLLTSKTLGQKCFSSFSFLFLTTFLLILHNKGLLNLSTIFFILVKKENTVVHISQAIAKEGNPSSNWLLICYDAGNLIIYLLVTHLSYFLSSQVFFINTFGELETQLQKILADLAHGDPGQECSQNHGHCLITNSYYFLSVILCSQNF